MTNDTMNPAPRSNSPSRRQVIAAVAATAVGAAVLHPAHAHAEDNDGVSRTAESIHQEPVFKATPKQLYEALIDTKQFDKVIQLSGVMNSGKSLGTKPTSISRDEGGAFTIFGGHIIGRQIELKSNERIVQAWRVVDWEPGVYSIAKFDIAQQGPQTKIIFDHTGFPKGKADHLATGWEEHYWKPLEKLFA